MFYGELFLQTHSYEYILRLLERDLFLDGKFYTHFWVFGIYSDFLSGIAFET